jgi:tRNA-2-methylthio-N6-dimethylallyladenosine synthase
MTRVFLETYGCQMNVADSELMAGVLQRAGMELVERPEDADAVILNTCAIREHAEQRVLGRLGDFARLKAANPALIVGVAGCMAQHLRAKLLDRKRVLDLVVGPDGYRALPELLRRAAGEPVAEVRLDRDETYGDLEPRRGAGVRAWVSVQRGCDKFCTYCVVPYTRGRERSLPLADLVGQMERAVAQGHREIVLLGQTVNSWRHGGHDFADLLRAADGVEGVSRVRFTSPHPADMSDRVIEAIATSERVMPHVHLPLQSGSDSVLERMNRTYTRGQFMAIVEKLRAAVPGISLTTDIIVGFPGETEEDFQATLAACREVRFDSGFLFKYSARPDTKAFRWPETVTEEEKGRRLSELIDMQHAISGEINDRLIGSEIEVLVENLGRREEPQLYGKSRDFKTVLFADDGSAPGTLRRVRVLGTTAITLVCESLDAPRPDPMVSIGG